MYCIMCIYINTTFLTPVMWSFGHYRPFETVPTVPVHSLLSRESEEVHQLLAGMLQLVGVLVLRQGSGMTNALSPVLALRL